MDNAAVLENDQPEALVPAGQSYRSAAAKDEPLPSPSSWAMALAENTTGTAPEGAAPAPRVSRA